jgi:predicted amidophosphoribosyltransferase
MGVRSDEARAATRWVMAVAAPARCGGCGDALAMAVVAAGSGVPATWCVHCRDRWGPPPGRWGPGPAGCEGWAAAAYRGPVRRGVLAAKRGAPAAAVELLLARLPPGTLPPGAEVTWVPGHPLRTIGGPDASRALADAIAAREGLVARPLLRRSPLGRRQAGRTDAVRRARPERLGLAVVGAPVGPVVLVDDVRTTGTTLDHAAALLRAAGAPSVVAITVAAAPSLMER